MESGKSSDSVFGVKGKAPARDAAKKTSLLESISALLKSKPVQSVQELEKKVEPTEDVQRAVEEAKKPSTAAESKKPLFGLIGSVIPEEVTYDLFTDGPFSAEYPDWPRLKDLPENCVIGVTNGVFTVELSLEEMEPLTFATYMKKIIAGVEEQLNAKILQKRVLLDSAYLEFVLVRDNKLWLYKAKIVECNRRFYTVSINGPKKEFQVLKPVIDHVLASVVVYKAGKPLNVSIEDVRDLSAAEREGIEAQMKELEEEIVESELKAGILVQAKAEPLDELIPIDAANVGQGKPGKQKPRLFAPPAPKAATEKPKQKPVVSSALAKPRPEEAPVAHDQALVEEPPALEPAPFLPGGTESPELKRLEEELALLEKEAPVPAKAETKPVSLPPSLSAAEKPAPKAKPSARPKPVQAEPRPAPARRKIGPHPRPSALPVETEAPRPAPAPPVSAKPRLSPAEREKIQKKLGLLDEALQLGVISVKSYKSGRAELRALLGA